ncbi:MAG: glycerol-3-phosphate 1-O-acyltransferase PlsY [Lentisphaerae bacterium]|nr:glycerol-3-phosphate 1-O-acyltransferase PlsY [Lentisphaerota bacterium]
MEIVKAVLVVLGAYLLGSIPWGFIIGKWNGVDVRKVGSNNIGATNVTRCVGKKAGKLCFVLDFLKGALPVIAAQYVFRNASTVPMEYVVIAALFATVLGHMFPVFLKFKGGKGVSTAAGAVMALTPYALLAALLVWVVVFLASRYVSLASIAAAAVLPIVAWVFYLVDFGNQLARSPEVLIFLTIVSLLAILRHHANIVRLLNGTENRFGKK